MDNRRDAAEIAASFWVCGTSTLVQPAASLTDMAASAGVPPFSLIPIPPTQTIW
jgi:hypothetical protein